MLVHGDVINLVSYTGHYLAAEGGGGGIVSANRPTAATWERFRIHTRGGSTGTEIRDADPVALQAYDGRYLSAIGGGGGEVLANRTAIGAWETFSFREAPHDDARQRRMAMELTWANRSTSGVSFAALDGDNDGLVERQELAFVRVASTPTAAASSRNMPRPASLPGTALRLDPATVGTDANVGLATATHELAHSLEAEDVYGDRSRN